MKLQTDIFFLMAILFAVAIALGASLYLFNALFAGFNAQPAISSCATCVTALAKGTQSMSVFPNALVLIFVMMCVASVILSAFIDSSPVFLVFVVISIPIELLVSFVFHDAFFAIANGSFIGTALASYPMVAFLFQYMPVVVLIMSVIIAIVTFAR
jgi:hypothetical protein